MTFKVLLPILSVYSGVNISMYLDLFLSAGLPHFSGGSW